MLVSMTGFGVGRFESEEVRVAVEARSVNHRYLEPSIRLPKGYIILEEKIRTLVSNVIQRGRVEISVVIEDFRPQGRTVTLDSHLLRSYAAALAQARQEVAIEGELTPAALLAIPELIQVHETPVDPESVWPAVEEAVGQALESVVRMRRAEGRRLEEDILSRLTVFEGFIDAIAARAPEVVEAYTERLMQRVQEWGQAVDVEPARLHGEIALMAERSNIDEEIVRARSHSAAFRAACASGGPVGRKLDFLLQELNREVNTIASKAGDAQVARLVVDAKAELEKIREQVQNIE